MSRRVAIIGVGWYGFKPAVPDLSFREMMFEASVRAAEAAGVDLRRDVDAFVSSQEDYWEGVAISDEFAPEPIGGVLRPTFTVAGDGLQGLAQAYMLIRTGYFDVVLVESHAKPSDILTLDKIYELALDPVNVRPLSPSNPLFTAGLDAVAYMSRTGLEREDLAFIAVKNRVQGLRNPRASYAARISLDEVLEAEAYIYPMTRYEVAGFTDAAITVILASEDAARRLTDNPVWVSGVGWSTETGTGALAWHEWGRMKSMRMAADMAYRTAGVKPSQIDLAEVEDRFSFMEPLTLEEARLAPEGGAAKMAREGVFSPDGSLPVNPSGGSLAMGVALEATGLARLLEAYLQLAGAAGPHQVEASRALVASWRGPPTYTSMAVILESGDAL
ncbi:MAG: thiolase domain-containing protein [Desulfurococcales archaeon]|nr:thiolase domain-containing protein [Desulfurococcales archaeon]